jgi:hypothetical protein
MKKTFGLIAASMLLAAPVLAADAPTYNCDYEPSCEVAPGIYGAISSPVKSKFDLSIGGYVKLDYAYNSVNQGPNGFLLPNGPIPKSSSNAGREDQSLLSAKQSRFWFKVAGPTFLGAKTGALIEADFSGTSGNAATENQNPVLRLRHAYGTLDWANTQVLFGQTQDIFGPMQANTVDNRAGVATGTPNQVRVPQLRLTQKVNFNADNSLKLVVGVQNPVQDTGTNTGGLTDTWGSVVNGAAQAMFISKALGQAPGYYGLAMNNLTIGAFGLIGSEKVGLAGVAGNNKSIDSYGYGIYAFVPILKSRDGKNRAITMSFEGQAYMASGMFFNSATGNQLAANGVTGTAVVQGTRSAAKGYGIAGQLVFYPLQDLGITGGYQRRNAYNYGTFTATTAAASINNFEKSNQLVYANVAYDLNAAVRVAAEYENQNTQYGRNTSVAAPSPLQGTANGNDNTIRLALYYFF